MEKHKMKIITLHQPYASFIAAGLKKYETRSWSTNYRGKLAIHSAKRLSDLKLVMRLRDDFPAISRAIWVINTTENYTKAESDLMPLGSIVAIADLIGCELMSSTMISEQSQLELAVGNWVVGSFAWRLENVIALPTPIPYKGSQGLTNIDPEHLADLEAIAACSGEPSR